MTSRLDLYGKKGAMHWIYLSPHLDDVALSCGGLVWEQVHAGDTVEIWTICAGSSHASDLSPFALELHTRWGLGDEATAVRRAEDLASCRYLSAEARHFNIPDAIYRQAKGESLPGSKSPSQYLYDSDDAIMGPIHPAESALVEDLRDQLRSIAPENAQFVSPLALGGHVDHRLVRAAIENASKSLLYYADYPYVLRTFSQLEDLHEKGWQQLIYPISAEGVGAWQRAIAAHASQISSFWADLQGMRLAIETYAKRSGDVVLWRPPGATS